MPKKIPKTIKEDIKKFVRAEIIKGKVSNISMRYISQNMGIGTGTIYNYYKSKEDIYFEIAQDEWLENALYKLTEIECKTINEEIESIIIAFNEFHSAVFVLMGNIEEKDKYYLFFILFKRMSEVVLGDLTELVTKRLIRHNIEFDDLKVRMLCDYIRFTTECDSFDIKEMVNNICKIFLY